MSPRLNVEQRFWAKVDQTGECWLWTAGCTGGRPGDRYGAFFVKRKFVYAHRFAYELLVGPIPVGREVDHRSTCPKICVNPVHLRLATHKQNQENRVGATTTTLSGIRGVYLDKRYNRWMAKLQHQGRQIHVGNFDTPKEAEAAVITKRLELFTHNDADRAVA